MTIPSQNRLSIDLDGRSIKGRVATTRLALTDGGERHVCLLPLPAHDLCRRVLSIRCGDIVRAAIDPSVLQSPLTDRFALLAGLELAGRLRLLRLLLTTGTSLFDRDGIVAFGGIVDHLVETAGDRITLLARSPVGRRAWILSWRIPADLDLPPLRAATLLADGRTQRIGGLHASEEVVDGRRLLHLLVARPLPAEAEILVFGPMLLRLGLSDAVAPRPLAAWLEGRDSRVRAEALAFVEQLAATDADAAILRAELACPRVSEPSARALHLSRSPAGLLYAIGVEDPRGLLSAIRVRSGRDVVDLSCSRQEWHARQGSVVVGLVPGASPCAGAATISPLYLSGRIGPATAASIMPATDLLPDIFRHIPVDVAAPLLACSVPATMAARPIWRRRHTAFGHVPSAPTIAVVFEAASAPEYLHAVVASIITGSGGRAVDIILHHRDGPATATIRAAAEGLAALHRIGLRVVSVASDACPSECLRAALEAVRAPQAIVLGPGSLPIRRGWLASWRRRLAAGPALGAILAEPSRPRVGDAGGYVVGLGPAAMSGLLSTAPILSGVLWDIRATATLAVADVGDDSIATYEDGIRDDFLDAVEALVVAQARGGHHV